MNVCVPTLRRYDLLRALLQSLEESSIRPDVYIIDNGQNQTKLRAATNGINLRIVTTTPLIPYGVAESWNWFMQNVPEERVITNDDTIFAPESLAKLTAAPGDLLWAQGLGFSCFVIRDSCIRKIGLFDETISPGYAYYEDEDYLQRLDGRGSRVPSAIAGEVECGVRHRQSSTLRASSPVEMEDHHRKFKIAQGNYVRKWGLEEAFEAERVAAGRVQ